MVSCEQEAAGNCKKRVEHLQKFVLCEEPAAHKQRMDRLLVDYLLRIGCYQTAFELAMSCGVEDLLDDARWLQLVDMFREENFRAFQLSPHPVFSAALQAGLSALKTSHCYKEDPQSHNKNCPVCYKHLNEVAKMLPFAHRAQSSLICGASGEPMNEHNHPMMLPNGHVYGEKVLLKIKSENDGAIVCPRTNEVYDFSDLEKVYIM